MTFINALVEGQTEETFIQKEKFNDNINHPRFLPFLVLHEFETFLFSSPKHVDEAFPELEIENNVNSIKNEFNTIEEIDEGHVTHPSARIINLIPSYQKRIDGPLITKRIGLETIRKECRHFDNWLIKIEEIANN